MRDIYLHGALGETYGEHFRLDVSTAAEAVRALCANFPRFAGDLQIGEWHVVRGADLHSGVSLEPEEVATFRLGRGDLHIVPALSGAKNGGVLKVIAGIALIGISFGFAGALAAPISTTLMGGVTWGNAIGMLGLSLALSGVSQLLAPEQPDEGEKSNLMSGSAESGREGTGMPLIYGEVITGGIIASTALDVDQLGNVGTPTLPSQAPLKQTFKHTSYQGDDH
jgi:predicted phage tail protein